MESLYMIESGNFVKIGIANDVKSRIASLQTGNPNALVLLACYDFPNASVVEKTLHQKYDSQRVRGEWFDLDSTQIQEFKTLCAMLGGNKKSVKIALGDSEIKEAENIQEIFLDNQQIDNLNVEFFEGRRKYADGTTRKTGKFYWNYVFYQDGKRRRISPSKVHGNKKFITSIENCPHRERVQEFLKNK